jgi:hypothetical protein
MLAAATLGLADADVPLHLHARPLIAECLAPVLQH